MADLTRSNTQVEEKGPEHRVAGPITDAEQTYAGALAAIDPATGKLTGYATTTGLIPLGGRFSDEALGDASSPPKENNIDAGVGRVSRRVSVTGVSAQTDVGKPVFASDDNVLTLTATGNQIPAGWIERWHNTTICDVAMFSANEQAVLALCMPVAGFNSALGNQA